MLASGFSFFPLTVISKCSYCFLKAVSPPYCMFGLLSGRKVEQPSDFPMQNLRQQPPIVGQGLAFPRL